MWARVDMPPARANDPTGLDRAFSMPVAASSATAEPRGQRRQLQRQRREDHGRRTPRCPPNADPAAVRMRPQPRGRGKTEEVWRLHNGPRWSRRFGMSVTDGDPLEIRKARQPGLNPVYFVSTDHDLVERIRGMIAIGCSEFRWLIWWSISSRLSASVSAMLARTSSAISGSVVPPGFRNCGAKKFVRNVRFGAARGIIDIT